MNSFSDIKVLIIGETIIDEYVYCETLGKSGKEPILVVRDMYKERYLGGTAAIARNLSSFCKKITLFTNIGQKNNEKKFIKNNLEKNIKTIFLNKNNSPTITKKRFVDLINKTKIFGVYSLNDQPLDRDQESKLNRKIQKLIKNHDLVIVSDYGHGLISDKTAKLIVKKSKFVAVNTQLNSTNLGFHVISKYIGANFITINETEMRHELRNKTEHRLPLIKTLSKKLKSKYTHVTSGDMGSIIYDSTLKEIISCPAFASKVMDKVGTGDTMLAILAISLFKKFNIKLSMFLSALAAAQNIQYMANKIPINKVNITRALQSYLK
jgi:rfaE bifunctional protein kinase chain/domain